MIMIFIDYFYPFGKYLLVFRKIHKSGISDISVQKLTLRGFKKFQRKIKFPPVRTELTTPTITGLEVRYLFHSATQTCDE